MVSCACHQKIREARVIIRRIEYEISIHKREVLDVCMWVNRLKKNKQRNVPIFKKAVENKKGIPLRNRFIRNKRQRKMISETPDMKRMEFGMSDVVSKYKGEKKSTIVKLVVTYIP